MFLFASSSFAEIPVNPHFTPMSLMPRPFASASGLKVAGIYWLPDYLGKNISRGSSDDVGGGDIGGNCEENYGMHTPSNIDDKYTCSKYNYNVTSSLKCHVNCRCKDEYQYTSSNCSGNYTTAGTSCEGKYNQCVCKSEFRYNSSNCSGEYEVSGTSCGGYYNACTIRPDCAITSKDCDYGCASINSCSKCTECKTCIPNAECTNANYPFSSESIAHATFTSCTPGCRDNTPKYKFQSCVSGYVNTDTFWCGKPATLNCATLGYTKSSCSGGLTAIGCPFDSSKKACLDFN